MSSDSGGASLAVLLEAVHEIEPVIRAHAADAEASRRLPDIVADAMRRHGLYRMWRPRAFGGLELDPMTAFEVLETVSRIDSAAGWNLQLSSAVDAFGAWFSDEGAEEIFGQPDSSLAGAFFPFRRAVAVDGGYHVTGRTPFVSGAHQAAWFMGLAHVHDSETPRLGTDGAPVTLITACPAKNAVILDTWRTLGMRGTGSHDVEMTDAFVPLRHTALLAPYEKPGSAYTGPLYKFTAWTAISVLATPRSESRARRLTISWNLPIERRLRTWRHRCATASPFRRRSAKPKPRSARRVPISTRRCAKSGTGPSRDT